MVWKTLLAQCKLRKSRLVQLSQNALLSNANLRVKGKAIKIPTPDKLWTFFPPRVSPIGTDVLDAVSEHVLKNNASQSIILDVTPGPGFLVDKIIKSGCNHLHLFEHHQSEYYPLLEDLKNKYEGKVTVNKLDFNDIPDEDITATESFKTLKSMNRTQNWQDDSLIKVIMCFPPPRDIRILGQLYFQLATQGGIYSLGRVEVYAFISCLTTWPLSADYKEQNFIRYRASTVIANAMFDIDYLGKVSWSSFIPKPKQRIRNQLAPADYYIDAENAYFIRIVPKANLPEVLSPELWMDFLFFSKQIMTKRSNYVIPFLEKWVPNCGPSIIRQGIPLFTRFGDLSPEQLFNLFINFTKWPEYEESTFKLAVNSATVDFDVDEDGDKE